MSYGDGFERNSNLTDIETQVSKALSELENTKDFAEQLKNLTVASVKEVEVSGNKNAIVLFVPYQQHSKYQKIQAKLIRELEKKFSGKHVLIIAQRTILTGNYKRSSGQMRPRSRTLTAVHAAILEDIVYPIMVVGKRIRVRQDTSKLLKVYLDPKDHQNFDYKLKTFSAVYTKLTNKSAEFLFE